MLQHVVDNIVHGMQYNTVEACFHQPGTGWAFLRVKSQSLHSPFSPQVVPIEKSSPHDSPTPRASTNYICEAVLMGDGVEQKRETKKFEKNA